MNKLELYKNIRNIYVIDNKSAYFYINKDYDVNVDLILTFDFWVKNEVQSLGGKCEYLDNIIDNNIMQKNNHLIYKYFSNWYLKEDGSDVFNYKGISFGMAFRQDIWNDFTFYLRIRASLGEIPKIKFQQLVVVSNLPLLHSALIDLSISYKRIDYIEKDKSYYFPIFEWNQNAIRPKTVKNRIRKIINKSIIFIQKILDIFGFFNKKYPNIFVQQYHPTKKIIENLTGNKKVNLTLLKSSSLKNPVRFLSERLIPMHKSARKFENPAVEILEEIKKNNYNGLILENGDDVTTGIKKVLINCIEPRVADYIRMLDSIIIHFDKTNLDLLILIANIGIISSLVDAYCKARGIKRYLIINGMFGQDYLDESKYATVINSYSLSIRDNYFKGMNNVVCLGDPRMDNYSALLNSRKIDYLNPTITIGTSGFNNVDLNSHLSIEFEFIFEVITAIQRIILEGRNCNVIIKVRPNGYKSQYSNFLTEYFPDFDITIIDDLPMISVLLKSDYYISIYSQTLFEASALGIPALYYKKDVEINQAPFNNNSELVTVSSIDSLVEAIHDFYEESPRYLPFLKQEIMEKYIGPLDGKNLERNLNFIEYLLHTDKNIDVSDLIKEAERC